MKRFVMVLALGSFIANAKLPADTIAYRIFRFTGIGQADPESDRAVVEKFAGELQKVAQRRAEMAKRGEALRPRRVRELEQKLAQLRGSSRADEVRRDLYQKELDRLRATATPPPPSDNAPPGLNAPLLVLVDALPNGVHLRGGEVSTDDAAAVIVGSFTLLTEDPVPAEEMIDRAEALARAAGGNVATVSYLYGARNETFQGKVQDQTGECHGVVGYVFLVAKPDPSKITPGRVSTDI